MMNMRISGLVQKQIQPLVNFPNYPRAINSSFFRRKDKVVFVVGPTGTGKSRLAIDIATKIPGEVINCDKMQVYKGLDTVTNKVTDEECRGVPHHLLGVVGDPCSDFTSDDFRNHASDALKSIVSRDRLPIIVGGSNSFIEALAYDDPEFRLRYECCFLWVDVSLTVLHSFVSERVDRMVKAGLVDEVRNMFDRRITDYSQGIRRAIGVPELDGYFRSEGQLIDGETRAKILDLGIAKIKENTCVLAHRQLKKIQQLHRRRWSNQNFHRLDATEVFLKTGEKDSEKAWEKLVVGPGAMIVEQFLDEDHVTSIIPSEQNHHHRHHYQRAGLAYSVKPSSNGGGRGMWGPVPFPSNLTTQRDCLGQGRSYPETDIVINSDLHHIIIILIQYTYIPTHDQQHDHHLSNSNFNHLISSESINPLVVLLQFCTINRKKKRVKKEEKKPLSEMLELESVCCFEE